MVPVPSTEFTWSIHQKRFLTCKFTSLSLTKIEYQKEASLSVSCQAFCGDAEVKVKNINPPYRCVI